MNVVLARDLPYKISKKTAGRTLRAALLLLGLSSIHSVASASENGGFGPYGVGAQTLASGILGPPGATIFYGYALDYAATRFVRSHGESVIPEFHANVIAQATMTRHTWNFTYAGFNFGSAFIEGAAHSSIHAAGAHDDTTGMSFINLQPVAIGRHMGDWHVLAATHLLIPVGHYNKNALANSSYNYLTVTPELSVTWLPTPQWMVDLSSNVSFNQSNPATHYHSGDLLGLTWAANYRLLSAAPRWQIGVSGLYLKQLSDDTGPAGAVAPDGFRLRKISAGPQFGYWISPAAAVVVKWQKEWEVRNGPKGNLFWLQAAFPI